jgi:hypothetical protein
LYACESRTNFDTIINRQQQPLGFQGGTPKDVDEIEVILERLDGHGDAIADSIHPSLC